MSLITPDDAPLGYCAFMKRRSTKATAARHVPTRTVVAQKKRLGEREREPTAHELADIADTGVLSQRDAERFLAQQFAACSTQAFRKMDRVQRWRYIQELSKATRLREWESYNANLLPFEHRAS